MKVQELPIESLIKNPNNPRVIKDAKFKKLVKSLQEFPEMLKIRPIVTNKDMVILGGNQRYEAMKAAGMKTAPVIVTDLTPEQQQEFIIKDNASFGEWDWETLGNEWNKDDLVDWGLDVDEDDKGNKNKIGVKNLKKCPECGHEF